MAGRVKRVKEPSGGSLPRPNRAPQLDGRRGINQTGASATQLPPAADTAIRLLQDIKTHRIDPRDITPKQRRACLLLIANGSQTSAELAVLFCTSPTQIRKDLRKLRNTIGREVSEWTLEQVLGQLALSAEKCSAQAMKNEDPGLAWTIQRDMAKLLQDLGVIGPREDRAGFKLTLEGIGAGYERARVVLGRALDPRLTGEVIDVTPDPDAMPALALDPRLTGAQDITDTDRRNGTSGSGPESTDPVPAPA